MDPDQILASLRAACAGTLVERMEIDLVSASRDEVVGTMPVAGNTQPYGLLHGGASAVLAETLGSIHALLTTGPDKAPVGIEINATHHRAARSGLVTGVSRPIHVGGTMMTFEIVITDDQGKRICTSRLTCIARETAPGS